MSGPRMFISYRRSDTAGYAGRLYDALSLRFGPDRIFMDIDRIPIASDYQTVIDEALGRCDLVLVLIGPAWLSVTDRKGDRRLEDPDDLVRLEVVEALKLDVRVLPVLVAAAGMPASEDLPRPLAALARIQALELSDRRWRSDLEQFFESVEKEEWGRAEEQAPPRPTPAAGVPDHRWWLGAAVAAAAVLLVAMVVLIGGGDGDDPVDDDRGPTEAAADRIVFHNLEGGGIQKIGADGSGLVTLSTDGAAPAPSPDGKRIAFEREHDGTRDVYVMDADGSNERRLTSQPGGSFDPAWSPDGRTIVFESRRDGNSEVYAMAADGTRPTRLTVHPAADSDPTFSPDGRFIAFDSDRDANREIYRMTATGSDVTRLTRKAEQDSDAAWSPDGAQIAFEAQVDGNFEVYVMNADGTQLRQLTRDPAYDFNPDWSPDGTGLVFTRSTDTSRGLYVMNADGSGQRQLAGLPAGDPDWGAA